MKFEASIFVNVREAKKYYKFLTRKSPDRTRKKYLKYFWKLKNDKKFRDRNIDGIKKVIWFYDSVYEFFIDYYSQDPTKIERIIIIYRLQLKYVKKEENLLIARALQTLEAVAKRTFEKRQIDEKFYFS